MGLSKPIALYIFFFLTILPQSILVPSSVGSAVVVSGYLVFSVAAAIHWHNNEGILRTVKAGLRTLYPVGLVCLSLIAFLYFAHVTLGNFATVTNAISGVIVPVIVVFNLVYVPRLISPDSFLRLLAAIATLIVGVGAVVYLAVVAGIAPAAVLWPYPATVPIVGVEFYPLASVMNNPNTFGQVVFAGAIASLVLYDRDDRTMYGLFLFVTVLGLLASVSRASLVSAGVAFGVYAAYTRFGRRALLTTLGLLVFAIGGAIALIPTLNQLGFSVSFTGRIQLWKAAVQAIGQQPLLGHGLGETSEMTSPYVDQPLLRQYGPHNSYLRMALHLGIFGGIAYLVFTGWVFLKHVSGERIDIAFLAIASGFAVNQLFEEHTMFGPTAASIIMTISFGYLIVERTRQRSEDRYSRHRHRSIRPRTSRDSATPRSVPTRSVSRGPDDRDRPRTARRRPPDDRWPRSETDSE